MDLKKYKYQLFATSIGINGIVHKKGGKTIFDPSDPKWKALSGEIIAAYKDGHLEMTKESAKAYKADLKKAEDKKAEEAKKAEAKK
jgi:hypothetical protein